MTSGSFLSTRRKSLMETQLTHAQCSKAWRDLRTKLGPTQWAKFTDEEFERCRTNYLHWRQWGYYAFSIDKDQGALSMPTKDYNRVIHSYLENETLKVKMFPKTRQMVISWEIAAYICWYAQFHPGSENMVFNKKENESAYMVATGGGGKAGKIAGKKIPHRGRIWSIYSFQPEWLKERVPAVPSYNLIQWAHHAVVQGYPEGEEQFISHQPAIVWIDEAAAIRFNPHFHAALPMAKMIIASSTPDGMNDYGRQVMDKNETSRRLAA